MVSRLGNSQSLIIPFFQDMVAFSCCAFDDGDNEKKELDAARETVGYGNLLGQDV
jgi:hypothetical protein